MREIKFRAWWEYEDGYKMVGMEELWKLDIFEFCVFTILATPEERQDGEKAAFMQYTGLKDRNGKEIYEGDIVECWFGSSVVKFDTEYGGYLPFVTEGGCGCCSDISTERPGSSEVIGNIYENHELLSISSK